MVTRSLIHVSVFPGWIAGVTYHRGEGYRCWVINPDLAVLNDGEIYPSSQAAIAAGRQFIHYSIEAGSSG
ncbi:MAG: hypothetical protein VKO01_08805 [Cyanobacteriota bacterium]|jgi:hypothetical protein|nr:hypothetical protein [Cyanobacteriota bacterium]